MFVRSDGRWHRIGGEVLMYSTTTGHTSRIVTLCGLQIPNPLRSSKPDPRCADCEREFRLRGDEA
jgi:hypothetical protein